MYAVSRHALRLLPRYSTLTPCRIIAGRRFPINSRTFHRSATAYRIPDDGSNKANSALTQELDEEPPLAPDEDVADVEVADTAGSFPEQVHRAKEQQSNYGSSARRSARGRKPREFPPVELPEWFLEGSVRLAEETRDNEETLRLYEDTPTIRHAKRDPTTDADPLNLVEVADGEVEVSPARYNLHKDIWKEILAMIRTGLTLPKPSFADGFPAAKSHVLLQCPKDGGIFFLDAVVEKAAAELRTDLVRIDAQDLAEIGGDYIGEGTDPGPYSIRSLAYEAQQVVARQTPREIEEEEQDEEEYEPEEEDDQPPSRGPSTPFGIPSMSRISAAIPITALPAGLADLLKSGKLFPAAIASGGTRISLNNPSSPFARSVRPSSEQWNDMKLSILLESFLDSNLEKKRNLLKAEAKPDMDLTSNGQEDPAVASEAVGDSRSTVIMIRDYKEINSTAQGGRILSRLHEIVRKRRKEGQSIVLIGTVSSADLMPSVSKYGIRTMQSEYEDGLSRTIIVTPARTLAQESVFGEDESRRIRGINMRHLRDMIRRRGQDDAQTISTAGQTDWRLDSSLEFASGVDESVWPFDRVHRIAVSTLGAKAGNEPLTPEDVGTALQVLDASDEVKFRWASEEKEQQKLLGEPGRFKALPVQSALADSEEKMKKLRKGCNTHEKRLLGGVVNPENIHTAFNDVRAPPETIEALKTLTSLSLIRPEAFSYGVLATDKIPGLLLYGPPGTGKTLLAKAVAKESGATMLEVSGAEVYDMYVGEGEKNVKAIFSLAKKLSPCVVFIDEADAIFGSRSSHANRTSHRELINMFLQQWDGMNDLSAFIMVATNRPFDLDDAVLRRLPRRLLVDLPTEKDREEILKIHLKGEVLDADVSLSDLASQTNLYSGSDLKNISVAAALSCVREEVEYAASNADYKPPAKRTLAKRHFERALDEISASISEDMGSLSAIKKFDEKYGDRRGKKKKVSHWGFGEKGGKVETGRVRN